MENEWLYDLLWRLACAWVAAKFGEWMSRWSYEVAKYRAGYRYVAVLVGIVVAWSTWSNAASVRPQLSAYSDAAQSEVQRLTLSALFGAWVGVLSYPFVVVLGFPWVYFVRPIAFGVATVVWSPVRLVKRVKAERSNQAHAALERIRVRESQMQSQERIAQEQAAQRRREQARLLAELEYARHCPQIHARLPRAELDGFLARYMSDAMPPTEVESRSRQLVALIQQHAAQLGTQGAFASIDDVVHWFVAEKAKIAALPLDDNLKSHLLAELNERYCDLTSEVMRKVRP